MCMAKDELQRIRLCDAKINNKLEDLSRLKALATKVTATMGGSEGSSGTRRPDKLEDVILKIIGMEDEINSLIDEYVEMKRFYSGIIDQIPNETQISVLYGHYFNGKSFEKLAEELGYSRRNVCYINGAALQNVERLLKEKSISK